MTVLNSNYSDSHRAQVAEYRRHAYFSNGWDKVLRWNGRDTTTKTAGISGPSTDEDSWIPVPTTAAGDCAIGVHVVRYRYLDSGTGYVSNPSEEREVTVASGGEQLTFPIDTSGTANILRSTDAKVDRIVLEATIVGGTEFFKIAEALNSASSIVASMSDAELETQFLAYDDDGHDVPPVAKNIVSHRERLWLFGQVVHTTGNATFTGGSVDVAEGSTDPDWRATALGDSTASPDTYPAVTWFIQKDGDAETYEIETYDESLSKIILKSAYAGVDSANANYKIFSRANTIWVSRAGFPEGFIPLKFLNGPNGESAGDLTAGLGYGSSMIFFSRSTMTKLSWETDPLEDPIQIPLSNKYGALNQRVVIEVEGTVYAMDYSGWTAWKGTFPQLISRPIDAVRESIDYGQASAFHVCYFPKIRAIRWFVCYAGESYPKRYVQLDIDTGQWGTGRYLQEISESRVVPVENGIETRLGDSAGHTWVADTGYADGCDEDYSVLVADAGSTTTAVVVTASNLPTANVGLAGCYLRWLKGDGTTEDRLIASNTASLITVSSAYSSAPASGDPLWVGPIPAKLKTKAFTGSRRFKKRAQKLYVSFTPTASTRYLQMRVYESLSSTAKTWASTTGRNNPDGAVFPGSNADYPTTDWLINMGESDGQAEINIGSEWRRYFELELEISQPDADIELIELDHDGQSIGESSET